MEIHQVLGSNLVDILVEGVPGLWVNCAEIVFVRETVNRRIIMAKSNIVKLCEIIVFIIYVPGISVWYDDWCRMTRLIK